MYTKVVVIHGRLYSRTKMLLRVSTVHEDAYWRGQLNSFTCRHEKWL